MNYPRVDLNDPTYRHVKNLLAAGIWACDSVDHNEDSGCSNPDCFKHPIHFEGLPVTEALKKIADRLDEGTGFNITKPVERKLEAFARRLRLFGNHVGTTSIGVNRYEIQVEGIGVGYTILSVNGKRPEEV